MESQHKDKTRGEGGGRGGRGGGGEEDPNERKPSVPVTGKMEGAESERLAKSLHREADWKNFGPYLSERAWGTVREDYSEDGSAWSFFPHDHARSRAYRWNEDGLAGVSNRFQNICLAVALWNEQDPSIKERLYGLTGPEGNHGEDCKEYYYYLDCTPTHSWMRMLYKYPQSCFPYEDLVRTNAARGRWDQEYELIDALREPLYQGRYFDVFVEYAKADEDDLLCRITAVNRGPDPAPLHIMPHIWFRNTWSWGFNPSKPSIRATGPASAQAYHRHLGEQYVYFRSSAGEPQLLFTENETNASRLFGLPNPSPYVKDSINDAVVQRNFGLVNPAKEGTKMAAHASQVIPPGGSFTVEYRFSNTSNADPFGNFDQVFSLRKSEADEFYGKLNPPNCTEDEKLVQRQAFAGLLFSKQFYHYSVELWLTGDNTGAKPPERRLTARNADWKHLYCNEVISMPDKWEYPWFAAWDLCFHCIPLAMVDPEFAKRQLILILREWYMHPNGQIPAYEWAFGDVNPPVHAYAAYKVYKIDAEATGYQDFAFLERIFHKLLLNFTWWVNRKDQFGNNVFQGGFLGLDNIGVFDRSAPIPNGGILEQSDGTAWMGMYCLNMLRIALELADHDISYEDVATKFFEHFMYIANAIYTVHDGASLWCEEEGFFFDLLRNPAKRENSSIKLRSFVGLISLFSAASIRSKTLDRLPNFKRRLDWFVKYRPQLVAHLPQLLKKNEDGDILLAIVSEDRLKRIMKLVLSPEDFLSDYGLRSLSKHHQAHPFVYGPNTVQYEPAESRSGLFGGNSNWRGPIWFPVNYLMIDSLFVYHKYYGDKLTVSLPTGSSNQVNLKQVCHELSKRILDIFLRNPEGRRPVFGGEKLFQEDPHWKDYILFYEYFHGCEGAGLGASHQTGWTALIARTISELHTIFQ